LRTSTEWCEVESLGMKMTGSSQKSSVLHPSSFELNS